MKALREGIGGKTRDLFEATLARDPAFARAYLALGGWHADIVSRAGRLMARALYGATRKKAVENHERALVLAPESKVVLLEYALRLPELDRKGGRERVRELLSKAVEIPVRDAYDGFIQQRIVAELAALEAE